MSVPHSVQHSCGIILAKPGACKPSCPHGSSLLCYDLGHFDLRTTPLALPLNEVFRTLGLLGMPPNGSRIRRGKVLQIGGWPARIPSLNRNSPALLSLTMPCVGEVVLDSDALIGGCSEGGASIGLRSLLDEMQPGAVLLLHLFY
jgi:hypothetical protein